VQPGTVVYSGTCGGGAWFVDEGATPCMQDGDKIDVPFSKLGKQTHYVTLISRPGWCKRTCPPTSKHVTRRKPIQPDIIFPKLLTTLCCLAYHLSPVASLSKLILKQQLWGNEGKARLRVVFPFVKRPPPSHANPRTWQASQSSA
jgi:hypothetical protein